MSPDGRQPSAVSDFKSRIVREPSDIRRSDDLLLLYGSDIGQELRRFVAGAQCELPPVAVLSLRLDRDDMCSALDQGATSYLVESQDVQGLAMALQLTARGGGIVAVLAPVATAGGQDSDVLRPVSDRGASIITHVAGHMDRLPGNCGQDLRLSPQQRQIMTLLTSGLAVPDVAHEMVLSEKTVRNYLSHIYSKLGVRSQSEAILCWLGLLNATAPVSLPVPVEPSRVGEYPGRLRACERGAGLHGRRAR